MSEQQVQKQKKKKVRLPIQDDGCWRLKSRRKDSKKWCWRSRRVSVGEVKSLDICKVQGEANGESFEWVRGGSNLPLTGSL